MHQIDHATAAAGGLFTEGDPVSGTPGTVVTDDWLNAVQLEIANAIRGAGIALDKANNSQLLAAIPRLVPQSWRTGDVKLSLWPAADTGWIVANDGTIGSALSGATTRANADCEALYKLLWNNVTNAYAPVAGGRGATADADWSANKPIALTKMLGRALAVAGTGASLSARVLGQTVGAETHQLSAAEMPTHGHGVNDPTHAHNVYDPTHAHAVYDPGHSHTYNRVTTANGQGSDVGIANNHDTGTTSHVGTGIGIHAAATGIGIYGAGTGISIQTAGGGVAHNNMQPTAFLHAHIKL